MGPAFDSHPPMLAGSTAEGIIGILDDAHIDKACIFPPQAIGPEFEDPDYSRANRAIFEAAVAFPDRLIGIARIDPNQGPKAIRELRRCHDEYQFCGLKLHPLWEHFHPDDIGLMTPVMEACEEYRWPVLCHTGHFPVCQPSLFIPLAERFPKVNIVLFHLGYAHTDDAIVAAEICPNIFLETSSNSPASAIAEVIRRIPIQRLIFGSDLPYHPPAEMLDKIRAQPALTNEDTSFVLGGNIARLLAETQARLS